jgi:hypothetical protein
VQKFGGVLMIVADNKPGEDPKYLVMADDGSGASVQIPSMLIGKSNGEKLKNAIMKINDVEKG